MSEQTPSPIARNIIEKLGGVSAATRLLKRKNPSSIHAWLKRGYVPARWQQPCIDAAKTIGVEIGPEDFFVQKKRRHRS